MVVCCSYYQMIDLSTKTKCLLKDDDYAEYALQLMSYGAVMLIINNTVDDGAEIERVV